MLLAYTKGDFKFVRVQLKWLQCIKWAGGGDERCSQGFKGLDQTRQKYCLSTTVLLKLQSENKRCRVEAGRETLQQLPLVLSCWSEALLHGQRCCAGPPRLCCPQSGQSFSSHLLFGLTVQKSQRIQKVLDMKGHPLHAFQKLKLNGVSSGYLLNY